MADTAALVVALSAQLTKFEKDMQKAGIMAERAVGDIEGKFSRMNPKISTSFFGNFFSNIATKGMDAAIKGVTDLISRFEDLQKTAEYAGVSLGWLYSVQEAGSKAGASIGSVNEAVKSLAFSLDEMKRGGDNALKTLLDANPQFMKGVNRDTMDVAKTLEVVSNIIQALPNQIQRVDVATKLGMPAAAVALLQQGGDAVAQMAAKAEAAGPALEKIAAQSKAITEWWALFASNLSSGFIDLFFEKLKLRLEQIIALFEKLQFGQEGTALGNFIDSSLPKLREFSAGLSEIEKPRKVEVPAPRAGTATDPFANKPSGGGGADPFERAVQNVEKHTAATQANTQSVGLNVAEQERMRVVAELNAVASRNGASATAEQTKRMEEAAEAAGKARMEYAIAQERLNKLNAASQAFGSALANSFADAILEGKKLNDVMADLLRSLARMAINSTIMSLFTPGAGQTASPFASLFKAEGGPVSAGRPYIVGERGPELMIPNQGGMIVPNDVLRQGSQGSGSFVYSPAIDARGASVEAVARLAQIMEADRASFASRTVATIQQARRGRVPGL